MGNTIQSNKISTILEKNSTQFSIHQKVLHELWIDKKSLYHGTLNIDMNSLHHDSHRYQKTRRASATVHPVHEPCKSSSTQSDAFLIITGCTILKEPM